MREKMLSFIGQVCLHTRNLLYEQKLHSATEWQRQDKTQILKNNIQIGNAQKSKNTIYNTDNYVWGLTCENLK